MSRLRQSIKRRLRRADSPPVPRSRDLSTHGAPAGAHLPPIPEAAGGAHLAGALAVDVLEPAAVWPPTGQAAAAVPAAAPSVAPVAAPISEAAAPGAAFEEVDLSEPALAAPCAPTPRRFAPLSCACFAGQRLLR